MLHSIEYDPRQVHEFKMARVMKQLLYKKEQKLHFYRIYSWLVYDKILKIDRWWELFD